MADTKPTITVTQAQPNATIIVPKNTDQGLTVTNNPNSTAANLQGTPAAPAGGLQGNSAVVQPASGINQGGNVSVQGSDASAAAAASLQPAGGGGVQTTDVSNKYANVGGTIYDMQTGQAFATPQQFFKASGQNSFNGLKFNTTWKPSAQSDQGQAVNDFQDKVYSSLQGMSEEQLNDVGAVRAAVQGATAGTDGGTSGNPLIPSSATGDTATALDKLIGQMSDLVTKAFDPTQSATSLVDQYNSLMTSSGQNSINQQLLDMKTVMNGSADDIKKELLATGGMVTDSGVQFLAAQRNKVLLQQYDRLQNMQQVNQQYIDTVMTLTGEDQKTAQQKVDDAFNMTYNIAQLQNTLGQTKVTNYAAARDFAVANGIQKPFYEIGGTVYSTSTGLPFGNVQQYIAAGGSGDFTDVQKVTSVGQLQAIQFTDSNGNVVKGYWNPVTNQIINPQQLAGVVAGTPGAGNISVNGSTYDLSKYNPANPDYPTTIQTLSGNIGSSIDPTDPNSIDSYIQSVAPNSPITGDMVQQAASQYNVDPSAIMAIMQQESSFGTAGMATSTYNPGNVGNETGVRSNNLGDWQSGVNAVAGWLANHPGSSAGAAIGTTGSGVVNASIPGYTTGLVGGTGMTQAAIDNAAQVYLSTKTMPSLGLSGTGSAALARKAVLNRAGELAGGQNPAAIQAQYKAGSSALNQQVQYLNTIQRSINTVDSNISILEEAANYVNDSSSPMVNQLTNKVKLKTGDGALNAYQTALQTVRTEYSQILARGGQVTEGVRQEAAYLIPDSLSKDQLNNVIDVLRQEGQNVVQSAQQQVNQIQQSLGGGSSSSSSTPDVSGYLGSIGVGTTNNPADTYLDNLNFSG